ncbi:hypothetical protein HOLleu_31431 [Holothuria leucospilota]|uniref:Uncharacterized protein n=1 Tax=Holothuria leucospilota TaxID=206669 RepID=A0A9Q0YT68_HOLLE|nr:hypothetical protein HOLleu_31431 [Holothuria leucospilota]
MVKGSKRKKRARFIQDKKVKVMTLLHVDGPETVETYNTFQWDNDANKTDPGKILLQLEKYCNPRKNVTYERHKFNLRNQLPGESIDTYVTDLLVKAQSLNSVTSLIP